MNCRVEEEERKNEKPRKAKHEKEESAKEKPEKEESEITFQIEEEMQWRKKKNERIKCWREQKAE